MTLTIVPTPSDAKVTINGEERGSITVERGAEAAWEVSAEGYVTQSGTLTLEEDTELPVTLEEDTELPVTLEEGTDDGAAEPVSLSASRKSRSRRSSEASEDDG